VLSAVELALEAGVPTKTHVLNLLHRLIDGKPLIPPTVDAPQALTLTNEPKADVERYDVGWDPEGAGRLSQLFADLARLLNRSMGQK
jgi:hypothetical protein